jgi:hypothetical protein
MAHAADGFSKLGRTFPEACRYVLEALGAIYHHNELAPVLNPAQEGLLPRN